MPVEKTYEFTDTELADAANCVRVVLTDALHGRGPTPSELLLLTGSKSKIEAAILNAIHEGVARGRKVRAERQAAGY